MKKTAIIISLLSLISAYTFNTINLHWLRKSSVDLRFDETVQTADDNSYIVPASNFLKSGEFKNNMSGNGSYFLRPPGYPILFIITGYVFEDKSKNLAVIKSLQLILFTLSVYCFFFIANSFLESKRVSTFVTAIYGISNISSCFVYYTLTEGVTPALVIFFTFFLLQAKGQHTEKLKKSYYFLSSIVFAYLFITRPVLGILGLAIPCFLYADYWKKNKNTFLALLLINGIIASSGMILWQTRNWSITNEFVGFHPIYYPENSQSCFRPTHEALWDLCKGWGEIGSNFHSYFGNFWSNSINGNPTKKDIETIINRMPPDVINKLGRVKFEEMFSNYQQSILHQKKYYDNNVAMPKDIPKIETKTIAQINALRDEYRNEFGLNYYIISPLKVFKEMAFHSNLSLFVFQNTFRNNPIMEAYRLFCFLLHSISFCILMFSLFFKKPFYLKSILSFAPILYVCYLIFIQRGIEERYTLPILPFALLSLGYTINNLILIFSSTNKRTNRKTNIINEPN